MENKNEIIKQLREQENKRLEFEFKKNYYGSFVTNVFADNQKDELIEYFTQKKEQQIA
ncbi:hypothetical protein [Enterococcus olivae]